MPSYGYIQSKPQLRLHTIETNTLNRQQESRIPSTNLVNHQGDGAPQGEDEYGLQPQKVPDPETDGQTSEQNLNGKEWGNLSVSK